MTTTTDSRLSWAGDILLLDTFRPLLTEEELPSFVVPCGWQVFREPSRGLACLPSSRRSRHSSRMGPRWD